MCLTVCSNVNCFFGEETKQHEGKKIHTLTHGTHTHTTLYEAKYNDDGKKSTTSTKTLDANDFNVFAKYIMLSLFCKSMKVKRIERTHFPRVLFFLCLFLSLSHTQTHITQTL